MRLFVCIMCLFLQFGMCRKEGSSSEMYLPRQGRGNSCRYNKCKKPRGPLETSDDCRRYIVYRRCQTLAMKTCNNQREINRWVGTKESAQEIRCYMKSDYYIVFVGVLKPKKNFDITFVDCQRYNLIRKLKHKGALSRIIFAMTRNFWNAIPQDIPDKEPGFEITKLNCTDFAVRFRVFVNVTGAPGEVNSEHIMTSLETSLRRIWADDLQSHIPHGFDVAMSQVVCSATVKTYEPNGKKATFQKTMIDQMAVSKEVCRSGRSLLPEAKLKCRGDIIDGAKWGTVKWTHKCIIARTPKSSVTEKLQDLQKGKENPDMMDIWKISRELEILVSDPSILVSNDITYIANVLDTIAEKGYITSTISEKVMSTISNVIQADSSVMVEAEDMSAAASRIIKAREKILLNTELDGRTHWKYEKENMAVEIWDINHSSNYVVGLMLKQQQTETSNAMTQNSDEVTTSKESTISLRSNTRLNVPESEAAIMLPASVIGKHIRSRTRSKPVRLIMDVFTNTNLFSHQAFLNVDGRPVMPFNLNSKVISATLSVDKRVITDLGGQHVKTVFFPKVKTNNTPLCVYWNTTGSYGEWATAGCHYNRTIDGHHTCFCDHLTNFAILMDFSGQKVIADDHKLALTIITYIGLCVSIGLVGFTILSFVLIKKLRTGRSQQTLLNLCIALCCSWSVFLAGINRTESYIGCIIVAVMLHYFILVAFMWMLVEGCLQYLRFVVVLGTYFPRFILKAILVSWGVPLIPVIITLGIDYKLYKGGNTYCWMSLTAFYYAFAIPIGIIILINIVLYVIVMWKIFNRPKGLQSNQDSSKTNMLGVKAAISVFVLLGLSWVFGYFTIEDGRLAFSYIFTIVNVFQGLYLFVLFVARDAHFRQYWKYICCRKCMDVTPIRGKSIKSSTTLSTTSLPRRKSSAKTNQTHF